MPDGDPLTAYELGSEAVPDCLGWATGQPCGGCWVCRLVAVFREVRRVLRPDGCCWINCGSAYQEKQELMLPARLALALQADGWWLRAECIWHKLNPLPESVRDRPTKAHEQVYLLTKSPKYFYDAAAVKEATSPASDFCRARPLIPMPSGTSDGTNDHRIHARLGNGSVGHPAGRNLRSVWSLASEPTPFAHFATFPSALVRRCLLASVSAGGCCRACGRQYVRQTAIVGYDRQRWKPGADQYHTQAKGKHGATSSFTTGDVAQRTTTGFAPACACGPEAGVQPATVLDPFLGSGTTLLTARDLFIRSIGVELNPTYCDLAASRLTQGVLALAPGVW